MVNQDDIRARISKRMKDLGLPLTGKWLKDHGVGQTTIRNFLDGMTQSLTVESIAKIAGPLKVSERWIIFGQEPLISEEILMQMVENAVGEIQPGLSFSQIKHAVASALHEQIALYLSVGGTLGMNDADGSHDAIARFPSPTTTGGKAKSRNLKGN